VGHNVLEKCMAIEDEGLEEIARDISLKVYMIEWEPRILIYNF
jgi:hypothetical protein